MVWEVGGVIIPDDYFNKTRSLFQEIIQEKHTLIQERYAAYPVN